MTAPNCHVFCERRGSAICSSGELGLVKKVVNSLSAASDAAVAGDYAAALTEMDAARVTLDAAAEAAARNLERRA